MSPKTLNILDALENLNTLVDADSLEEIEVTEDAHLISHKEEETELPEKSTREVYWVRAGADDLTLNAIKTTFRSVYDYLRDFYSRMKQTSDTKRLVEGINTIMVLVGEAAKKMDRFGTLFKERVSEFKEYRELQSFYRNKVIRESFQAFARTPIAKTKIPEKPLLQEDVLEEEIHEILTEPEMVEEVSGVHILNDIEVIKKDHLYELFYLKNEAGLPFYSFELARNLKLACDFGEFADEYFGDDPLLQIKNWEDKALNLMATKILKRVRLPMEKFYKDFMHFKDMDLVVSLNNTLMALMMASNPRNLIRQFSLKGCHLYFSDFLRFLRETLNNREYQKFLLYSAPQNKPFFQNILELVDELCYALFSSGPDQEEVKESIKRLTLRLKMKMGKKLSESIGAAHFALADALQKHPSGPVFKALDIVRDQEPKIFDPILQGNFPEIECSLVSKEKEIKVIRTPCPIQQEWINQAVVTEEFKTFLRRLDRREHLLYINFQDRTAWREHARAFAIEDLARQAEFAEALTVVTLPKDTDFYNQTGVYENIEETDEFLEHFLHHLRDEGTGFHFPTDYLRTQLFVDFMPELLLQIHETFFTKKKRLSYLERLDFIELTYHLIVLKLIELIKPHFLVLTSKDGLDIGATSLLGFLALLAKERKWKEQELETLNVILFGPTLLNRERAIHIERFDRLEALVRLLEKKENSLDTFDKLFNEETLNWNIRF